MTYAEFKQLTGKAFDKDAEAIGALLIYPIYYH
jgi:hypothetical protein